MAIINDNDIKRRQVRLSNDRALVPADYYIAERDEAIIQVVTYREINGRAHGHKQVMTFSAKQWAKISNELEAAIKKRTTAKKK